jgi:HK97 gp10 family phage protein
MSIDVDVKFEGFDELSRNLSEFSKRVERNIVMQGLRAGGRVIVVEARMRVPVRSGRLKKSMGMKANRDYGGPAISIGPRSGKKEKYDAWYSHLIEFGTKYQSARPFLRPAIDAKQKEILEAMGKKMSASIKEIRFVNR